MKSDKPLFTPGPLTTSGTVKQAMLRDLGSRDPEFIGAVAEVRKKLLDVAGTSTDGGHEAVIMQGSGTLGLESVVGSVVPRDGAVLAVSNGVYGERIGNIASVLGIPTTLMSCSESQPLDPDVVEQALADDPGLTDVTVVHCETSTGIINPVEEIVGRVKSMGRTVIVDSMSAFGAVPLDLSGCDMDYLVSSANKCLEGVPGFSFVICRRDALLETEGRARSLGLDLLAQWRGLESNGQFRFTPPTHAILAFQRALVELEEEGGVTARCARYRENHATVLEGMRSLGFQEYLPIELQGWIITSFLCPDHPCFEFEEFYARLSDEGFVIYPGKVSDASCFRIGHIGHIGRTEVESLLEAIGRVQATMGFAA